MKKKKFMAIIRLSYCSEVSS